MPAITGSEILIKTLEAQGAEKIFSIPGGQLLGVYEAIRKSPALELIVPRQEGAGALMACGYALAKGDPGVVISTVGAGVIYELAGIYHAWLERIPVISIAPQVQSYRIKPIQENLQAMDQDDLYAPLTKFHAIMYHLDRIPQLVARAYKIATSPEPGPVHLDLPLDIAFASKRLSASRLEKIIPHPCESRFTGDIGADPSELEVASRLISEAERPLALLGRLIARPDPLKALGGFLEKAGIPAISSNPAFSALPKESELSLGTLDLYDDEKARGLIRKADLLLYLEPDSETVSFVQKHIEGYGTRPAIQLSSHQSSFQSFAPLSARLAGSPGLIFDELAGMIQDPEPATRKEWLQEAQANKASAFESAKAAAKEHRLRALAKTFDAINRNLRDEDFVVCEGKDILLAAKLFLGNYSPGQAILIPDSAPAGGGFPLALGIKAAAQKARVFLVSDRKKFKYHCREFQTASRYKLGICSLVFPDKEPLDEEEPEFAMLAESLGVKGFSIQEPVEELTGKMLGQAFELEAGSLLEIRAF
jgi:acetolactate synthase-1/2/3 large subunit